MALVGCYVALSKPLALTFPVLLLAWLRFGIGALAMPHWLIKPANDPPMTSQTRRLVFLESLLGNFLFSICMLYGVSMTSATSAGVIFAAIPAAVAMMSWVFLRERIAPRVWAGVACAVVGIALLTLTKQEHSTQIARELGGSVANVANVANDRAFWGNLLLLGAVVCEAAYAVIGKKLTGVLGPKRIAALINLWGFALMTPFGIYLALDFNFGAVAVSMWWLLVFYAVAASVWTVWLWMTGLKSVPSAQAGVFTVMLPLTASLTGVVVLGERLSGLQAVAFGIALLGVLLATFPARKTQKT